MVKQHEIESVELLIFPPHMESIIMMTAEHLRTWWTRKVVMRRAGVVQRKRFIQGLDALKFKRAVSKGGTPVCWGMLFFDRSGKEVGALFFDENGREGTIGTIDVAFEWGEPRADVFAWLQENFGALAGK
jgi:hypothetical protein